MTLSPEQMQAIRSGKSVRVCEDDIELVVLRADVFEQLQSAFDPEAVLTAAETLDKVMAEDDANDPYLAQLQKRYGGVLS